MGIDLLSAMLLCSAVMQTERANVSAETIARLINDLDAPRYATREEAGRKLLEAGEPALAPLKQALTENRSLEFRLRAGKFVRKLALYEPGGGEVVGGLTLRLTLNRDKLRTNDRIYLTTLVGNMSDKPMRLDLGPEPIGNYWEAGSKLQRVDGGKVVSSHVVVGFNAPGTVYRTLGPKSFWEFETPISFLMRRKGDTFLSLGQGYTTLDVPLTGEIAVRAEFSMNPPARVDAGVPLWNGTVRSNTVHIKLVR